MVDLILWSVANKHCQRIGGGHLWGPFQQPLIRTKNGFLAKRLAVSGWSYPIPIEVYWLRDFDGDPLTFPQETLFAVSPFFVRVVGLSQENPLFFSAITFLKNQPRRKSRLPYIDVHAGNGINLVFSFINHQGAHDDSTSSRSLDHQARSCGAVQRFRNDHRLLAATRGLAFHEG